MPTCHDVMTKNPTCCLGTDTIDRAAQIMKNEDVGSVPVVEDTSNKLVGILTDRDIVVQVIAGKKDCGAIKAAEIMTRNPVTCNPDDDIQKAMDRMSQQQVRRVPVVDKAGKIVGIIAQADLATRMDRPEKTEKVLEKISQPAG